MSDYRVFVISARRPHNVPHMESLGEDLTWVVPEFDAPDYQAMGAKVVAVPERENAYGLPVARNLALDMAEDESKVCVQTDDDLRSLKVRDGSDWRTATLGEAIKVMMGALDETGARLAGLPPTSNTFFARPGVMNYGFIIASIMAAAPAPERFDEQLPLKEDYDYTCRHLAAYGSVARTGDVVADYQHYSNSGGAVTYRTGDLEHTVTAQLLERWPQYLRLNPRREHELLFRTKR